MIGHKLNFKFKSTILQEFAINIIDQNLRPTRMVLQAAPSWW